MENRWVKGNDTSFHIYDLVSQKALSGPIIKNTVEIAPTENSICTHKTLYSLVGKEALYMQLILGNIYLSVVNNFVIFGSQKQKLLTSRIYLIRKYTVYSGFYLICFGLDLQLSVTDVITRSTF